MGFLRVLLSVSTTLRHLIYISYLVPASRVRPLVPAALRLDTVDGDRLFVSLVLLKSTAVRPPWLPWSPIAYNQLNLRTYVRHPQTGERAVYFFTSAITSRLMLLGPHLLGLPWKHIRMELKAEGHAEKGNSRYSIAGVLRDPFRIGIEQSPTRVTRIEPFDDPREGILHITMPSLGFISSREGIYLFRVVHPFARPSKGGMVVCDFPDIVKTGLVTQDEIKNPEIILIVDRVDFLILMPPARLP